MTNSFKMTFFIPVVFIICGLSVESGFAQNPSTTSPSALATVVTSAPIALSLAKEPTDNLGTDTTNIYTLTVNYADPKLASVNTYKIFYYVDNILLESFPNEKLPFILKRNYKGLLDGDHVIKIVLEVGKDVVLTSGTIKLNVQHNIK